MSTERERKLQQELDAKTEELQALQRSFDDYAHSSKELEAELESAVEQLSADNEELKKESENAKQSIKILELQLQALKKNLPSPTGSGKGKKFPSGDGEVDEKRVELEFENENLRDKVHRMAATEEELEYKLQRAQEEAICCKSELEGLTEAKAIVEQELAHYKIEIESLRGEVERSTSALQAAQSSRGGENSSNSHNDDFGVEPADMHLTDTVQQLELQLEESNEQLERATAEANRAQQQVQELMQELEQKNRMLAARPSQQVDHTVVVDLKNEVYALKQQLAQRVSTAQLAEKDAMVQELQAELEELKLYLCDY